mgnify:CR=1 FL=1
MKLSENIIQLLFFLPIVILGLYSLIVLIGNHTILRAGGTSAHENYPKIMEQLKTGFISISFGFILFFLVIFGFISSDALVVLISVGAGVLGTIVIRNK